MFWWPCTVFAFTKNHHPSLPCLFYGSTGASNYQQEITTDWNDSNCYWLFCFPNIIEYFSHIYIFTLIMTFRRFLMLLAYFYLFFNQKNLNHHWKLIIGVKFFLVMLQLYRTGTNTLSIPVSKNSWSFLSIEINYNNSKCNIM